MELFTDERLQFFMLSYINCQQTMWKNDKTAKNS